MTQLLLKSGSVKKKGCLEVVKSCPKVVKQLVGGKKLSKRVPKVTKKWAGEEKLPKVAQKWLKSVSVEKTWIKGCLKA